MAISFSRVEESKSCSSLERISTAVERHGASRCLRCKLVVGGCLGLQRCVLARLTVRGGQIRTLQGTVSKHG